MKFRYWLVLLVPFIIASSYAGERIFYVNDSIEKCFYNYAIDEDLESQLKFVIRYLESKEALDAEEAQALANCYMRVGRLNDSIARFDQAVSQFGYNYKIYYQRGLAHFLLGNIEKAKDDLYRQINTDGAFHNEEYLLLSFIYEEENDMLSSIEVLKLGISKYRKLFPTENIDPYGKVRFGSDEEELYLKLIYNLIKSGIVKNIENIIDEALTRNNSSDRLFEISRAYFSENLEDGDLIFEEKYCRFLGFREIFEECRR